MFLFLFECFFQDDLNSFYCRDVCEERDYVEADHVSINVVIDVCNFVDEVECVLDNVSVVNKRCKYFNQILS